MLEREGSGSRPDNLNFKGAQKCRGYRGQRIWSCGSLAAHHSNDATYCVSVEFAHETSHCCFQKMDANIH